jgi:hypothetical protein
MENPVRRGAIIAWANWAARRALESVAVNV